MLDNQRGIGHLFWCSNRKALIQPDLTRSAFNYQGFLCSWNRRAAYDIPLMELWMGLVSIVSPLPLPIASEVLQRVSLKKWVFLPFWMLVYLFYSPVCNYFGLSLNMTTTTAILFFRVPTTIIVTKLIINILTFSMPTFLTYKQWMTGMC